MMKHLASLLAPIFMIAFLAAGCEPKECRELKDLVCKHCGESSPACKSIKKRRGRDEKKCAQGIKHVESRAKSEAGKKTLCTLLNDEYKKKNK